MRAIWSAPSLGDESPNGFIQFFVHSLSLALLHSSRLPRPSVCFSTGCRRQPLNRRFHNRRDSGSPPLTKRDLAEFNNEPLRHTLSFGTRLRSIHRPVLFLPGERLSHILRNASFTISGLDYGSPGLERR